MTTDHIQDKRDGLELAVLFTTDADALGRRAILNTFEGVLGDYLLKLLDPSLDVEHAMWLRAKAIGLVETLDSMGVKISRSAEPITRTARKVVNQSLGVE